MQLKLYFCLMEIDDMLVNKLAMLARLHFNESDKAEVKAGLQKMISFIDKLNELDTASVIPRLHITENLNVLRDDEVYQTISRAEALSNAPNSSTTFFMVPKVINK